MFKPPEGLDSGPKHHGPWPRGYNVLSWYRTIRKGLWRRPKHTLPFALSSSENTVTLGLSVLETSQTIKKHGRRAKQDERETENGSLQEGHSFSVYRLVGVNLQEKTAEGTLQLPCLRSATQEGTARPLPPISMD